MKSENNKTMKTQFFKGFISFFLVIASIATLCLALDGINFYAYIAGSVVLFVSGIVSFYTFMNPLTLRK
jgi:uncharacterized membrane protein YjjP (DUF1212 family)